MKAITTVRDAIEEKAALEYWMESGRIGTLCRKGRTIYYANLEPYHLGLTVEGTTKSAVAHKLLEHSYR